MITAAIVARWFVIPFALATATACGPTPSANAPASPTANVSGTVAAQVQATVQALSGTRNDSPATSTPALATALPTVLITPQANPPSTCRSSWTSTLRSPLRDGPTKPRAVSPGMPMASTTLRPGSISASWRDHLRRVGVGMDLFAESHRIPETYLCLAVGLGARRSDS
jgi:hypothetical protein